MICRLKKIISVHTLVKEWDIKQDDSFIDDLGMDSLDLVCFYMSIEEKYNVIIEDDRYEELNTIDDIVNYIKSYP